MPQILVEQLSPEWFAARQGKITASIAAACIDLDEHNGPLSAYSQIVKGTKPAENGHMRRGTAFESHARQAYEIESGELVMPTGLWLHEDFDWLAASPDGLIGCAGLVEIKCPVELPVRIPAAHEIQIAVQLACTCREWCDYFAWTAEGTYLERYRRNFGHENAILARLQMFWEEHVLKKNPPPRRKLPPSDTNGNGEL